MVVSKILSWTTVRLGRVCPVIAFSAASNAIGPSSGLHSTLELSLPSTIAVNASFVPSTETTITSVPGLAPDSSMAWIAPSAMSSLWA